MPRRLVLVMLALLVPLSYSTANAASYWTDDLILFKHAHQVAPENPTARNNYALQLALSGDRATAMTMLQDLRKEDPRSFLANYNLGRLLYEAHTLPAAERYLRQAQSIDPGSPDPYLQLGMICMRTGRLEEAESDFQRAVSLRPDNAKFHFALGVLKAQRGECQEARSELSQALHLDPKLTSAQEQMDRCGADAAKGSSVRPPLPAAARVPPQPVSGR